MLRPVASWGDRIPHDQITKPLKTNVKLGVRAAANFPRGTARSVSGGGFPAAYRPADWLGAVLGADACIVSIFVFGRAASSTETDSAIAAPK